MAGWRRRFRRSPAHRDAAAGEALLAWRITQLTDVGDPGHAAVLAEIMRIDMAAGTASILRLGDADLVGLAGIAGRTWGELGHPPTVADLRARINPVAHRPPDSYFYVRPSAWW